MPPSPFGWTGPLRARVAAVAAVAAVVLAWRSPGETGPAPPPPVLAVDPNTAPPYVLEALPRMGPVLVERLVAARAVTPFRSLDDLDARIPGIGPATIAVLRPHLRFDPPAGRTAP